MLCWLTTPSDAAPARNEAGHHRVRPRLAVVEQRRDDSSQREKNDARSPITARAGARRTMAVRSVVEHTTAHRPGLERRRRACPTPALHRRRANGVEEPPRREGAPRTRHHCGGGGGMWVGGGCTWWGGSSSASGSAAAVGEGAGLLTGVCFGGLGGLWECEGLAGMERDRHEQPARRKRGAYLDRERDAARARAESAAANSRDVPPHPHPTLRQSAHGAARTAEVGRCRPAVPRGRSRTHPSSQQHGRRARHPARIGRRGTADGRATRAR